jgi:hypothetical protein
LQDVEYVMSIVMLNKASFLILFDEIDCYGVG